MRRNVSTTDRFVRLTAALVAVLVALLVLDSGPGRIVLLVVAAVLVVTALLARCPAYSLFGFSTCPAPQERVREPQR